MKFRTSVDLNKSYWAEVFVSGIDLCRHGLDGYVNWVSCCGLLTEGLITPNTDDRWTEKGHEQLNKSVPGPDLSLPLINDKGLHQK